MEMENTGVVPVGSCSVDAGETFALITQAQKRKKKLAVSRTNEIFLQFGCNIFFRTTGL